MFLVFKNLLKQSTIYTLSNVLSKAISLLMLPIYTQCLSPADYGLLELLFLVLTVAGMVFSLNLTAALPRYYFAINDDLNRRKLISTCATFTLGLALVSSLFLYLFRFPIGLWTTLGSGNVHFLTYIFILVAMDLCTQVALMYLRIQEKPLIFVGYNMTSFILGLILNLVFLVWLKMGVQGILYGLVISNGIVFLLLQFRTFNQVGFYFVGKQFLQILRFSFPLVPAALLVFVLNMGDRFMLARLSTTAHVGIYALGYKFGMLIGSFIGGPFLQAWEPKRAELFESNSDFREIFGRVMVYALVAMSFGCLLIACPITEILYLVADSSYATAALITPLVAMGYMFYNLSEIADVGIFLKKKTFWYPILNGTAALFNLTLNWYLIPRIGIVGSAIATAASFLLLFVITYWVSQKLLPLKYDTKRMALAFILALGIYAISMCINTQNWIFDGSLKFLLALCYPVLLLLIGFFSVKEKAILFGLFRKATPL
jgi:O-antigen/teichoic acid export membrane protein